MFNNNINRYNYYILNFFKRIQISLKKKQIQKIKKQFKKTSINAFYVSKQKPIKIKHNKNKTNKNAMYLNFFFTNINFFFKNKNTSNTYIEYVFYIFKNKLINNIINKYHWFESFFLYSTKVPFYFFVNKIKYFSSQRLVKQNILIMYVPSNNKNTYSNRFIITKHTLNYKNNIFFFNKIFNTYTNNNNIISFHKYNLFLKQFITNTILLILFA